MYRKAYMIAAVYWPVLAAALVFLVERAVDLASLNNRPCSVPAPFSGLVSPAEFTRFSAYTGDRIRLSMLRETALFAALCGFLLAGGPAKLDAALGDLLGLAQGPMRGAVFLLAGIFGAGLVGLPFSFARTFGLEARFGFNTTTPARFFLDRIKAAALIVALGGPVLWVLLALFAQAGQDAWLLAWGFSTLVSILASGFGVACILPFFNRLKPLPPGPLADRLTELCGKAGFPAVRIFVMDGSKRSAKANAFFAGLWGKRRIVLFDTLVASHDINEIVAAVAHEIGHWRLGHIPKRLVFSTLQNGVVLLLLGQFLANPEWQAALGAPLGSPHAALIVFFVLLSPASLAATPLALWMSRRDEYAADAFAVRLTGDPAPLSEALARLGRGNMAELAPHWSTVLFRMGHPPLADRLAALKPAQSS